MMIILKSYYKRWFTECLDVPEWFQRVLGTVDVPECFQRVLDTVDVPAMLHAYISW